MNHWDDEDAQYEMMADLGDPRHCPRHPHVKTSSNNGMFDAPCGECEMAMEDANERDLWPSTDGEREPIVIAPRVASIHPVMPVGGWTDDDIPF